MTDVHAQRIFPWDLSEEDLAGIVNTKASVYNALNVVDHMRRVAGNEASLWSLETDTGRVVIGLSVLENPRRLHIDLLFGQGFKRNLEAMMRFIRSHAQAYDAKVITAAIVRQDLADDVMVPLGAKPQYTLWELEI